jgi:hypothetical protein
MTSIIMNDLKYIIYGMIFLMPFLWWFGSVLKKHSKESEQKNKVQAARIRRMLEEDKVAHN